MTWCEAQVRQFNDKIMLDSNRVERVEAAIRRFEEFCEKDPQLNAARAGQVFLQGSVASKTVVRPLSDGEFDVDAVYPFHLNAFPHGTTPAQIIDWFVSRLKESEFYQKNLTPRDRCARINYAGDFHVDIIPATATLDRYKPYAVPAKDLGSWIKNDPNGYVSWVQRIDARSQSTDSSGVGRFVRCCRMMKRWRDAKLSTAEAPTSLVLVTMLGKHDPSQKNYSPPITNSLFPEYQTDMAYLYDMLRLTHSCLTAARRSAFMHPTIPDEDLSQGWDSKHLDAFMTKLQTCIDNIREGIYAKDEKTSLQHFKNAFGETFPAS